MERSGDGGESTAHQCVVDVSDPTPLAVRREDLECSDGLAPQDGDAAKISMAFQPDIVRFPFFVFGTRVTDWGVENSLIQVEMLAALLTTS